jgi:hypothetical protein
LWLLHAADPASTAYHVPLLVPWDGPLDLAALRAALDLLVRRHEILRTSYPVRDGRPVQLVADPAPVSIEVTDLTGVPDARAVAERAARDAALRTFALTEAAPWRCAVWTGLPGGDLLLLCLHHIAIDGWSLPLLFAELEAGYDAARAGVEPELPAIPLQYTDFAAWEREFFAGERGRELVARRVEALRDHPTELRLGALGDQPGSGADHLRFTVPAELVSRLARRARELRATPFVLLLAAFGEVVRRWSGQSRFLLGTALVNRPSPDLERTVGYFVNTVPLRCAPRPDGSFRELCAAVRAEFAELMRGQPVPLDQLVQELAPQRADTATPLIQVGCIVLHSAAEVGGQRRRTASLVLPTGAAKFDLTLLLESGEDFAGTVEFDTARYGRAVAQRVLDHFLTLLDAALTDPDTPVCRLPLTTGTPNGVLVGDPTDLLADHLTRVSATREEHHL